MRSGRESGVSFVDVPGHERFVRNMLAGAGGIEAVLLVVAADESVMPQTREHFEIVRMLGLERGVVAVTKTDRASPELVAVTRLRRPGSPSRLLAGGGSDRPGVRADRGGPRGAEGGAACRRSVVPGRGSRGPRRAASDRSGLPDRGLRSGRDRKPRVRNRSHGIRSWSSCPERRIVRVRRIEVHDREEEVAHAGERVSANLAGVELADLHRGLVLASPGALPVSTRRWSGWTCSAMRRASRAATESRSITSRRKRAPECGSSRPDRWRREPRRASSCD